MTEQAGTEHAPHPSLAGEGPVPGPAAKRPTAQYLKLALAVSVGSGLAHVGTATMPFQVGAVMEGMHRSAQEAGLFGFFEVAPLALSMVLAAPLIRRYSPLGMALAGCMAGALGSLGVYFAPAFGLMLVGAAVAGIGAGWVFAAIIAAAAASARPDRLYGVGNGGALLVIVATMAVIPQVSGRFGPLGVFAVLALLSLLGAPFMAGLGRQGRPEEVHFSALRGGGAIGLLTGWTFISCGTTALYAFSQQAGRAIGLPTAQIGLVLLSGTLVGLLGAGAAALFGGRQHRVFALALGMCGCAGACLAIGFANSLVSYVAGVFLYWLAYMYLYSCLQGTAATLDNSGRLGALGGGCERLGYAVGTSLGGISIQHLSFGATGVIGAVLCLLGLTFGVPLVGKALAASGAADAEHRRATMSFS